MCRVLDLWFGRRCVFSEAAYGEGAAFCPIGDEMELLEFIPGI